MSEAHRTRHHAILALLIAAWIMWRLIACAGSFSTTENPVSLGSCSLDLPPDTDDTDAIRAVLQAEGQLVVEQQIEPLMQLWAEDSIVADGKHTPDDEADDQRWIAKDAIRHRYVRTVFPGAPASVTPANLAIEIDGDRAVVRATTQIGDEVAPGGDRWILIKIGRCWSIQSLTYNLEPLP